jgi:aspartate aminotransferase
MVRIHHPLTSTLLLFATSSTHSSLAFTPVVVAAASTNFVSKMTATSTETYLDQIPMGPPDAILGIAQAFRACEDPRKVNVCVGAYRDEQGKPWILPSVRQAEQILIQSESENKEYLAIEGDVQFVQKALEFAYGTELMASNHIAGVQTLSGTGACRVGGTFLARFLPKGTRIYIPVPTWGNHWKIMQEAGFDTHPYRYYSRASNGLDWQGLVEDIQNAPDGSVILLHACAHNPTGCDPTHDQWKELCNLIQSKHHVAFFDSAYQGFASGDAEQDAFALRYFTSQNVPVLLAQSFAKNFGLYGERCGTLSVVCASEDQKERVISQLRLVIRPMYSNPPKHGSSIVRTVLSNADLTKQYYQECRSMADRIHSMRSRLVQALKSAGSKHDWSHVESQIGMFAYTGMTEEMCDALTKDYAIFLTRDGRISVAGLNENNVEYVAKAIHAVTDGKSITSE